MTPIIPMLCSDELEEVADRVEAAGSPDLANTLRTHARSWRECEQQLSTAQADNSRLQRTLNEFKRLVQAAA